MKLRALGCVSTLASLALLGCHRRPEVVPPAPDPAVLTTTLHARAEPALARRGVATAGARLHLGFNSPGVLAAITPRMGDVVKKGQLLARLKDGDASAALNAAQAHRGRALRDYGVAATLVDSGAMSANQRDEARSALQVADANASYAAESLGQRRLLAPISGTVLARLAEPGEAVGPGTPVLVLEDTQRLVVKVGVNERDLGRVAVGQAASLVVDGVEVETPGVVSSLSPAPGPDGLFEVEVAPSTRQKAAFRAGSLLTVRFEDATKIPAVRVPLDAIVHRDDRAWVFLVGDIVSGSASPAAARATLCEVTFDRADGKDVLVRSRLKDGDRIVREGAYFLRDGQAVRLLDPTGSETAR
jgi:RND family efflux transporter MFP subunit